MRIGIDRTVSHMWLASMALRNIWARIYASNLVPITKICETLAPRLFLLLGGIRAANEMFRAVCAVLTA